MSLDCFESGVRYRKVGLALSPSLRGVASAEECQIRCREVYPECRAFSYRYAKVFCFKIQPVSKKKSSFGTLQEAIRAQKRF